MMLLLQTVNMNTSAMRKQNLFILSTELKMTSNLLSGQTWGEFSSTPHPQCPLAPLPPSRPPLSGLPLSFSLFFFYFSFISSSISPLRQKVNLTPNYGDEALLSVKSDLLDVSSHVHFEFR